MCAVGGASGRTRLVVRGGRRGLEGSCLEGTVACAVLASNSLVRLWIETWFAAEMGAGCGLCDAGKACSGYILLSPWCVRLEFGREVESL